MVSTGIDEIEAASKQLRDGGNVDIALSFQINDTSDVIISLTPSFYIGVPDKLEFVIHLPGMETELLS